MARARSMLVRVGRLELARVPTLSLFGALNVSEAGCRTGIEEGYLDGRDVPIIIFGKTLLAS